MAHNLHRFEPWQLWPGSFDNPAADGNYPRPPDIDFTITKATPIASMGSCFAREIKRKLIQRGYHYITEETDHPASVHASAAWERVYNTFCMRQIFDYTFGDWRPARRWWRIPGSDRVQDPYRRSVVYESRVEAEEDLSRHRLMSRKALEQAEVLIITLGLTEIWQDNLDGAVISMPAGPYFQAGGDLNRYTFRVSRYGENLDNLERIHAAMQQHNPACRIIVTVSPVNLNATFRKDLDVISASCNSKATLRAVADEFAGRHGNVSYFPAFEMAWIYQPLLARSYFAEGRENFHVNKPTVRFIMNHFFKFFAPDGSAGG